jgi:hypothetical protein
MRISNLYNNHLGSDIYIVGTGPTLRMMPKGFFNNKIAIGLNQAYKTFDLTYAITIHPELIKGYNAFVKEGRCKETKWAVCSKKPPLRLKLDDVKYYVYHRNSDWKCFIERTQESLFCGRGIQQAAIDLAGRMGATNIILVGVDMEALGGDHHAHDQHIRFQGISPVEVYKEYRLWTYKAKKLAREHHGISVLSLSPLLGCGGLIHNGDYERLRVEMDLEPLKTPKDISRKKRKGIDPA